MIVPSILNSMAARDLFRAASVAAAPRAGIESGMCKWLLSFWDAHPPAASTRVGNAGSKALAWAREPRTVVPDPVLLINLGALATNWAGSGSIYIPERLFVENLLLVVRSAAAPPARLRMSRAGPGARAPLIFAAAARIFPRESCLFGDPCP
jgi:hypothetical protein